MSAACPACGGAAVRSHRLLERMRGSGEAFDYAECGSCGSVWLPQPPADLSSYYGAGYYSLGAGWRGRSPLRRALKRWRDAYQLWGRPWWGALLAARSRYPELDALARARPRAGERILDVGCGDGLLVASLAELGLDATGVDPNLAHDEQLGPRAFLRRADLASLQGSFDLITLNHSLEHMAEPGAALAQVRRLLAPGGRALVRVPTVSSEAWRRFGADWIQLDPPRHLCLFSREGFKRLAEAQGWSLREGFDDSGAFQFWGSLQWQRGIPLEDPRSWSRGGGGFSGAEMEAFAAEARALNARGEGDAMAWVLEAR